MFTRVKHALGPLFMVFSEERFKVRLCYPFIVVSIINSLHNTLASKAFTDIPEMLEQGRVQYVT